ncbi:hypothetical protein N0U24_26315, partial [Peribacillus frigoritolerans]|nr:hypothetical protein [Peribacillus frigoritolerans]
LEALKSSRKQACRYAHAVSSLSVGARFIIDLPLLACPPDENWPDPFLGETRIGRGCIGKQVQAFL